MANAGGGPGGQLGCAPRTLQRRFEQHLGVGPKWVLQRQRIADAPGQVEAGGRVDWAGLAGRLGFTDQPHLSRVFREQVGVPPAANERRLRGLTAPAPPRAAGPARPAPRT